MVSYKDVVIVKGYTDKAFAQLVAYHPGIFFCCAKSITPGTTQKETASKYLPTSCFSLI